MRRDDLDRLFLMAEAAYFSARREDDPVKARQTWQDCISLSLAYVGAGGDRNVHVYLNFALNQVGRVREAFDSCLSGLRLNPGEKHLIANLKLYSDYLDPVPRQLH